MINRSRWRGLITFLLGCLIGLGFFAWFYGLDIVNPGNTDWIWQSVAHDTAQHFLGWQFYRDDATGGIINGLAYPQGLSMVFMDVIPLFALLFKPLASILPANFQYFGLWGLLCYVLMGGLAAILVNRIWQRVTNNRGSSWTRWLFVTAGSLLFVLSPMVMARSFYHPALAGQWIILIGFLLIWDTLKLKRNWSLVAVWGLTLAMAVLIHPYFLPMMGALLVLSIIRRWPKLTGKTWQRWAKALLFIIIPALVSLAVFWSIGGFTQGSGSEVHDLEDKGFNLLSFINPGGYSIIPEFPNRSSSPETMMWLGLGVLFMLCLTTVMWLGRYRASWRRLGELWRERRGQCWLGLLICIALLVFAMGTRIDLGPITIFSYSVPEKIYELWSAFRAAAREAWPFYYATILLGIYWFAIAVKYRTVKRGDLPIALCCGLLVIAGLQAVDIINSPKAVAKRHGFTEIAGKAVEFVPLNLDNIVGNQRHLVALDDAFRGDQSGTYIIGQTALKYNLTLNTGFFARVSDEIKNDQAEWRHKLESGQVDNRVLAEHLFFTKDENLAGKLAEDYTVAECDQYYFILGNVDNS